MKKPLLLVTIACILSFFLDACQGSHKTVARKSSRQPTFIDNVYIAPHNKSNTTANAITPKRIPEKVTADAVVVASAGKADMYQASYTPQKHDEDIDDAKDLRKKYAGILGIRPKDLENLSLYQFIEKWYGTNYRLGGCDVSGIDCSGFVQKLYSEVYGIDLVRTAVDQFSSCKRIKRYRDAEEGDLVFFHVHSRRITHVGIYLANDYFVHASSSQGVMISNLNEEYYHRYFAGAGRIPRPD